MKEEETLHTHTTEGFKLLVWILGSKAGSAKEEQVDYRAIP